MADLWMDPAAKETAMVGLPATWYGRHNGSAGVTHEAGTRSFPEHEVIHGHVTGVAVESGRASIVSATSNSSREFTFYDDSPVPHCGRFLLWVGSHLSKDAPELQAGVAAYQAHLEEYMAQGKYVRFIERNDNEGETWNFYIPLAGNSKEIEHLRELLKEDDSESFSIHPAQLTTTEVDTLVKHASDNTSYMPAHNKLSGKLKMPDDVEDLFDRLYKGGIKDLMAGK